MGKIQISRANPAHENRINKRLFAMAWRAQFRFSFAFPLGLESLSNGPPPSSDPLSDTKNTEIWYIWRFLGWKSRRIRMIVYYFTAGEEGRNGIYVYEYYSLSLCCFDLVSAMRYSLRCWFNAIPSFIFDEYSTLVLSLSVREETGIRYFPREALRFTY